MKDTTTVPPPASLYTAEVRSERGGVIFKNFDDFTAACEWAAVRQNALGDRAHSIAEVRRTGFVLWQHPPYSKFKLALQIEAERARWAAIPVHLTVS
jgi:aminoglycoside phosphotransferase